MADIFRVLGQVKDVTADASLYIVPTPVEVRKGATQTLITSLIVCNRSTASNYDVRLRADTNIPGGNEEYLIKGRELGASSTDVLSLGLVLPGDAEILVKGAASTFSFNLLGIEIT